MTIDQLKPNKVLRGPIFPEPVQVLIVIPMRTAVKLIGKGLASNKVYEPILTLDQLASLETSPETEPFAATHCVSVSQSKPCVWHCPSNVRTTEFKITLDELDFYDALTRFVEDQSIKAASEESVRGRALAFTMAMLQRRFASSIYAVRRSLEHMRNKREKILADSEGFRKDQINKRLPEDFDDLSDDEQQQQLIAELEDLVVSYDPVVLKQEITELGHLIAQAHGLEKSEVESKLVKLRALLTDHGIFKDPKMKLLIFTEHKDTLDFLVGNGNDGWPLGKLIEWGLSTTQIHGGMKVGDRDTPRHPYLFRARIPRVRPGLGRHRGRQRRHKTAILLVYDQLRHPLEPRPPGTTHGTNPPLRAGKGLSHFQFRLHQHTRRSGPQKLFERIQAIEADLDPKHTGKVFNVLGDVFPENQLEKMIRDMYAHNQMTEEIIKQRIIEDVDITRFERITKCTLELLAKKELNISAIIGKSAEAKERRLVPEVIENFFVDAAPASGIQPKETNDDSKIYRVGRVPRQLWPIGERLEPRFGKLGREYKNIVFDKKLLEKGPALERVTPGHPLFEAVCEDLLVNAAPDLQRGSIFYDLNAKAPYRLDFFAASVKDGRGNQIHRGLFAIQTDHAGQMTVKQPTVLLDLSVASPSAKAPVTAATHPDKHAAEHFLIQTALNSMLAEVTAQRARETQTILKHIEISLNELINRQQVRLADLHEMHERDDTSQPLAANLKQTEDRIDELNARLYQRRAELERERECMIGDIQHFACAWVLPHPDLQSQAIAPMVSDPDIEKIAVQFAIKHEESQGRVVESVEADNRGFDLISRKPHPEDPKSAVDVRFIEVKGRAFTGEIALTANDYNTAKRLKTDYWLYVVFQCATEPSLNISDPLTLDWQPVTKIEQYRLRQDSIKRPVELKKDRTPYRA